MLSLTRLEGHATAYLPGEKNFSAYLLIFSLAASNLSSCLLVLFVKLCSEIIFCLYPFIGFWRVLDISYKEKVFSQLLKLLHEESWSFEEVPLERASDILEELYPR